MHVTAPILYVVQVLLVGCVVLKPLARALVQEVTTVRIEQDGSDNLDCVSTNSSNIPSIPCQSLGYALTHVAINTNLMFSLSCGEYFLESDITVVNFTTSSIVSDCPVAATTFVCTNGSSIGFHQCSDVSIVNVVFRNCGSSSQSVYGSALYFSSSDNIAMTNVTVANSTYRGVTFVDVFGTNRLVSLAVNGTNGGSGVYFEFEDSSKCQFFSSSMMTICPATRYIVNNCLFQNCKATVCTEASSSCMGGGIAIVFKGSIENVQMNFSNSMISDNEAMLAGGGVFVRYLDSAENNDVYLWHTDVMNNFITSVKHSLNVKPRDSCEVWTSGGGIAVLFSNSSARNKMRVLYSTIINNAANSGGGMAVTFQDTSALNSADIRFSNISSNIAVSVYDNPCVEISNTSRSTGNGGGVAFSFVQEARNNVAQIYSSNISRNRYTETGGGYSYILYDNAHLNSFYGLLNVVNGNQVINDSDECEGLFVAQPNITRLVSQPSGGGACLMFLGHSTSNFLTVTESISRNTAVQGGGLFVGFYDFTFSNAIVTGGLIHNNWLEGGTQLSRSGGGAMVEYNTIHSESSNFVQFTGAIFLQNNCSNSFGGAVAIVYNSPFIDTNDSVIFGHTIFSNNSCRYGRAIAATTVKTYSQSANLDVFFFLGNILVNVLEDSFRSEFEEIYSAILSRTFTRTNPEENLLGLLIATGTVTARIRSIIGAFTTGDYHVPEFFVRDLSDLQELIQDGQGLIYLRSVSMLVLSTLTVFCGGLSQGIFAVDSTISILPTSNFTIERCTATHGGAIALYDDSFLSVSSGVTLTFNANRALERGGAIYIRTLPGDVSRVQNCFLQHPDSLVPPPQWKDVRILFVNNTADVEGSSIHVREGLTCLPSMLQDTLQVEQSNILLWDNIFTFIPPSCGPLQVCAHPHVSSGPHKMIGKNNETIAMADFTACDDSNAANRSQIMGSPGDLITVPIDSILDIFNNYSSVSDNVVVSVASRQSDVTVANDSGIDFSIEGLIQQRQGSRIRFTGRPFQERGVDLKSVQGKERPQMLFQARDNRDLFAFFDVILECCPPGYLFNDSEVSLRCQCDRDGLGAYLNSCKVADGFQAFLNTNYWVGYCTSDTGCNKQELYYSPCPVGFCSGRPLLLPLNRSDEYLNELICGPSNRKGTVCGQCKDGFGMPINYNIFSSSCQTCQETVSSWGLVVWILSEWIPMLLVVLVILLFNVDLSNGRFHVFLVIAQVVPHYLGRGLIADIALDELGILRRIVYYAILFCNFWNLQFFSLWLPPFCLTYGSTLSILQVFTITFVIGLAPLCLVCLLVLLDYLGERCCGCPQAIVFAIRNFKGKYFGSSKYDKAIPTVFILSYARILLVPAVMGRIGAVRNAASNEDVSVLFFDGTIGYLTAEHLYYWIPVVIASIVILVPPTVCLILYPALPMIFDSAKNSKYKCLNWVQRLKPVDRCVHGMFSVKWMRHFLDVFQSSFKPKYRIVTSLFFLQRLLFVGIALAFLDRSISFILLVTMMLFTAMIISVFKPYHQKVHNAVNLLLLWVFTVISALNLHGQGKEVNITLQAALVCLPCIYVAGIVTFALYKLVKPCFSKRRKRSFHLRAESAARISRTDLINRFEKSEHENDTESDAVCEASWRAKAPL